MLSIGAMIMAFLVTLAVIFAQIFSIILPIFPYDRRKYLSKTLGERFKIFREEELKPFLLFLIAVYVITYCLIAYVFKWY